MKRTRRFLKRHGWRLAAVGIVGVVFVLWAGSFSKAIGHVPRYVWILDDQKLIRHVTSDGRTIVTTCCVENKAGDRAAPYVTTMEAWDVVARTRRFEFRFDGLAESEYVSPDGRYVAVYVLSSMDPRTFMLGDLHTGERVELLRGIETCPVVFSPDSQLLVYQVGSRDPTFETYSVIWDITKKRERARIKTGRWTPRFKFSADSSTVVALEHEMETGSVISVWDARSGIFRARFQTKATWLLDCHGLFISQYGDAIGLWTVLESPADSAPLRALMEFWKVDTKQPLRTLDAELADGDGGVALGLFENGVLLRRESKRLVLEDISSGREIETPLPAQVSPPGWDGEYYGLVTNDGQALWTFVKAATADNLPWYERWVLGLFRPYDLKAEHQVNYYDVVTGEFRGTVPSSASTHSPSPWLLAVQYRDGTVAIWDVPPRRPIPLILLLAALHTALILVPCWWFAWRR